MYDDTRISENIRLTTEFAKRLRELDIDEEISPILEHWGPRALPFSTNKSGFLTSYEDNKFKGNVYDLQVRSLWKPIIPNKQVVIGTLFDLIRDEGIQTFADEHGKPFMVKEPGATELTRWGGFHELDTYTDGHGMSIFLNGTFGRVREDNGIVTYNGTEVRPYSQ